MSRRIAFIAALVLSVGVGAQDSDPSPPRLAEVTLTCGECRVLVGESLEVEVVALLSDGTVETAESGWQLVARPPGLVSIEGTTVTGLRAADLELAVLYWTSHFGAQQESRPVRLESREAGDLDMDGLPDDWETAHGLDPLTPALALDDADLDGLPTRQERERGTHPLVADTDGDGRLDGAEVDTHGTDPLLPDPPLTATPDLTPTCTVSALNRSAPVDAEGVWVVPNVPSTMGRIRVRATCVDPDGTVRHGQSDFVEVPPRGVVSVPEIDFDTPAVSPATLTLTAPVTIFGTAGETSQLAATITFPDTSTSEVAAHEGTSWTTSNASIVSISPTGLATANGSGRAIVSASHDGATGFLALLVTLGGDSDGDGLPDDWELANGLDPADPLDALLDPDRDRLSTLEEFQLGTGPFDPDSDDDRLNDGAEVAAGTNPLLRDTDGDLVSDGLEVFAASDPLDPQSVNLAPILDELAVSPPSLDITVNVLWGEASRGLEVEATLIDGTMLDATAPPYGTTYDSDDLAIASFGSDPGRVFGGSEGATVVRVANGPIEVAVPVAVDVFVPRPRGRVSWPGSAANAVRVVWPWAYLATHTAQLMVVDVFDPDSPTVVANPVFPARGNGRDLALVGNLVYLALGDGGVGVVDVSNPLAPSWVGGAVTRAPAWGIVAAAPWLYVADTLGVSVFDISAPSAPVLVATVDTPGEARRLAVDQNRLYVADHRAGVAIVDINDPSAPDLVGSSPSRADGHSRTVGVVAEGDRLWTSEGSGYGLGGVRTLDVTLAEDPTPIGSTTDAFGITAVAIDRGLGFTSDYYYTSAVPIFDLDPPNPVLRHVLRLGGDFEGTDIALAGGFVYITGGRIGRTDGNGSGTLGIGQYEALIGVEPPRARIAYPAAGHQVVVRRYFDVGVVAGDDVGVARVELLLDGQRVGISSRSSAHFLVKAPLTFDPIELVAVATDNAGNTTQSEPVILQPIGDGLPAAQILAPPPGAAFIEDSDFRVLVVGTDDVALVDLGLLVEGGPWANEGYSPLRTSVYTGLGAPTVTLEATATDDLGQSTVSPAVEVEVIPDPAPAVVILEPSDALEVAAGGLVPVIVAAADNREVTAVEVWRGGVLFATLSAPPYQLLLPVPGVAGPLEIEAIAFDDLGRSTSSLVTATVVAATPTDVVSRVVDDFGVPRAGATVRCGSATTTSAVDGTFSFVGLPTGGAGFGCSASVIDAASGVELVGRSAFGPATPGGVTDIGDVVVGAPLMASGTEDLVTILDPLTAAQAPAATMDFDTHPIAASFDLEGGYWVYAHLQPAVLQGPDLKGEGQEPEPETIREGLQRVDLSSGLPLSEPAVFSSRVLDLTFDPADGRMLGVTFDFAWTNSSLVVLDPISGESTEVANLGTLSSAGLAFDLDTRQLWLLRESGDDWTLQLLDPANGTVLGTVPVALSGSIGGLAWRPGHRTLLAAAADRVWEIDPQTGAGTLRLDLDGVWLSNLALRPAGGSVLEIDVSGRVVDGDGTPLEGIAVRVPGGASVTAGDGTFIITDVMVRLPRLRVAAEDCCTVAWSEVVLAAEDVDVGDIVLGEQAEGAAP